MKYYDAGRIIMAILALSGAIPVGVKNIVVKKQVAFKSTPGVPHLWPLGVFVLLQNLPSAHHLQPNPIICFNDHPDGESISWEGAQLYKIVIFYHLLWCSFLNWPASCLKVNLEYWAADGGASFLDPQMPECQALMPNLKIFKVFIQKCPLKQKMKRMECVFINS